MASAGLIWVPYQWLGCLWGGPLPVFNGHTIGLNQTHKDALAACGTGVMASKSEWGRGLATRRVAQGARMVLRTERDCAGKGGDASPRQAAVLLARLVGLPDWWLLMFWLLLPL